MVASPSEAILSPWDWERRVFYCITGENLPSKVENGPRGKHVSKAYGLWLLPK
jgi:hypothetical protein